MSSKPLPAPLRGVIPPIVTPLAGDDRLDVGGLIRLVEHVLGGGVHGLFVLGTTGEGPSLSRDLRREAVAQTCRIVDGRAPVLVAVTDTSEAESVRLARDAADAGAAAVVAAPPHYFPIAEGDLAEYYARLSRRLPLPLLLYNMPSHTKLDIAPDLVLRLMEIDRVIGLKDSSPGATCVKRLSEAASRLRPDFALFVGPEELMSASVRAGAHGGVCGGANIFPRLFVRLFDASVAGDTSTAGALQSEVLRLAETVYAAAGDSSYAAIRAIKCALSALGICGEALASPLRPVSEEQRSRVARAVRAMQQHAPAPDPYPGAGGNGAAVRPAPPGGPAVVTPRRG